MVAPRLERRSASRALLPSRIHGQAGTRVIFIRHGHVHNPKDLIYGRMPRMRLSPRGRDDMERTARLVATLPVAAIYTSPLLRARESAAMLARFHPGVVVHCTTSLIEVRTSWQGESNKIQDEIKGFSYYDPLKGQDDETILDVFRRMDRALRIAVRRHPGQTTLCVSHGDPIKILRIGYSGMELNPNRVRAPDPGQASLVTFEFWHRDALPIITAVDYGQLERIIAGEAAPSRDGVQPQGRRRRRPAGAGSHV